MTGLETVTIRGMVDCWPNELADGELPNRYWQIVRTLPRQEKKLCHDLRLRGIPYLLPMEQRLRQYRRKGIQRFLVPLISGYVFTPSGPDDREDIYRTERTAGIIPVDEPVNLAIELHALVALLRFAESAPMVRPEIIPGKRVRITHGVLTGVEGIVRKRRGRCELIVNIFALGTSVSGMVDAELVEVLEPL
ncbi:MAG: hypothetical protein PF961_20655 [Planctomycetota bacterium]|jgi:transcription antitermination factor NusG|nr:hypothetical protein [Planctomycetota bacterium]